MRKTAARKPSPAQLLPVDVPTTAPDLVVTEAVEADWRIDGDRIHSFAQQIRQDKSLRDMLLANVAMHINQHRLDKLATGKAATPKGTTKGTGKGASDKSATPDLFTLYHHTEKIGALKSKILNKLERSFKAVLQTDGFWEEAAIWILSKLNDWEKAQQIPAECAIAGLLSTQIEPETPTTTWMEARTLSAYAYHAAGQLVAELDLTHQPLESLEKLLGIEKQPIQNSPLFQGKNFEKVATGYPIITGAQALINSQWKDGEYPYWRKLIGDGFIEHQIVRQNPETTRIELVPGKAAWEIIQQFGPEAAYIFLIFAAHATDLEKPWEGHIQIKGTDLIKLYGWDKRTDLTLGKKLKRIGSLVELVCRLSVCISNIDIGKRRYNIATSAMWLLEELEYAGQLALTVDSDNPELKTYQPEEPDELVIRVRPGSWTEKFLSEHGHQEREALRQYGYLAKSTLQINPYRRRLAAKLAIFLTVMSRIQPNGQYEVGTLLKALESETILEEIQENKDKRNKLVDQWDNALLTLQQLGWEIKFDPETYPEKIRPAWSLTEGAPTHSHIRPPNWLHLWVRAKIIINPTTLIQHRLEVSKMLALEEETSFDPEELEEPVVAESHRLPRYIPGPALEQALTTRPMSKAKLAEQLGLDRSMITRWINGSRPIQPKHRELLWQLLGKELAAALNSATHTSRSESLDRDL